tara:strand:- start:1641 stop:2186 length:546 start_codon:yes stop_codon:yes gene_type:complete
LIFEKQELEGLFIIKPEIFEDDRGYFFESYRQSKFTDKLDCNFVQDNEVLSKNNNIIRGLHYQLENAQGKLIHVVRGAINDIVVDIRVGSKNFGKSFSIKLSSRNHKMIYIPEGFAHGYLVLEKNTIVQYRCTNYYNPKFEYGIKWNDPDLNIDWGISDPLLSKKDENLPFLKMQKMLPKL